MTHSSTVIWPHSSTAPTGQGKRSTKASSISSGFGACQAGRRGTPTNSVKAFSETDFTEDLRKFDIPTLVMHGEDDQIVPVKDSAKKSAKLIKGAVEIYYPGLPHGLTATHADLVNRDLLAFCQQGNRSRESEAGLVGAVS